MPGILRFHIWKDRQVCKPQGRNNPKGCCCRKLVLSKSEYRNGDTITCGLFDGRVYAGCIITHVCFV